MTMPLCRASSQEKDGLASRVGKQSPPANTLLPEHTGHPNPGFGPQLIRDRGAQTSSEPLRITLLGAQRAFPRGCFQCPGQLFPFFFMERFFFLPSSNSFPPLPTPNLLLSLFHSLLLPPLLWLLRNTGTGVWYSGDTLMCIEQSRTSTREMRQSASDPARLPPHDRGPPAHSQGSHGSEMARKNVLP